MTLLESIEPRRVLIAGDFMLDRYTFGDVQRISPEAPIPILHARREESRPGGAGNAILNATSLGQKVVALGRIGDDVAGRELQKELADEGVDLTGLFTEEGYTTPVKNRLIARHQQLLRVDHEQIALTTLEKRVIDQLPSLLDVDAVAISDYAKGFLTPAILSALIDQAKARSIPIIVDPKGRDFTKYRGATVVKPNLSEARIAAGCDDLEDAAAHLLKNTAIEHLIITRSEEGISLFSASGRADFPVYAAEVVDVTGAGDTVLATLTATLANRLPLPEGVQLANAAAGLAVQQLGCARITLAEIAETV